MNDEESKIFLEFGKPGVEEFSHGVLKLKMLKPASQQPRAARGAAAASRSTSAL